MDELRWILLGLGTVLIVGVYLWGRRRNRSSSILNDSIREMPSFSARDDDNGWVDGVGPVRVVSRSEPAEQLAVSLNIQASSRDEFTDSADVVAEAELPETYSSGSVSDPVSYEDNEFQEGYPGPDPDRDENTGFHGFHTDSDLSQYENIQSDEISEIDTTDHSTDAGFSTASESYNSKTSPDASTAFDISAKAPSQHITSHAAEVSDAKSGQHVSSQASEITGAEHSHQVDSIDDVVSLFLVVAKDKVIKGEHIYSACLGNNLHYGDMKIFHRLDADGEIMFSLSDMRKPGWFDLDNINHHETRGVSLFAQLSMVTDPIKTVDDMLLCAHNISQLLGAQLCGQDRMLLNESSAKLMREKAKRFADVSTSSHN